MNFRVSTGVLAVTVIIVGYWWYALVWHSLFLTSDYLRVHFLDVGQGDAILIETPNSRQVLIDAGRGIRVLSVLNKVLPAHDRDIDIAVMTHPDADHIGGFVPVLRQYEVGTILQSFISSDTNLYKTVRTAIGDEKFGSRRAAVHTISRAYSFSLDDVQFDILWPVGEDVKEKNAASIVLLITYGDMEILLTGDAPSSVEEFLTDTFGNLVKDVDILKAGHHGSKTSTSSKFLTHTKPNVIVYSAGADNSYGHPHTIVIDRVADYSAAHPDENLQSYNTADGTVSFCLTMKRLELCE